MNSKVMTILMLILIVIEIFLAKFSFSMLLVCIARGLFLLRFQGINVPKPAMFILEGFGIVTLVLYWLFVRVDFNWFTLGTMFIGLVLFVVIVQIEYSMMVTIDIPIKDLKKYTDKE